MRKELIQMQSKTILGKFVKEKRIALGIEEDELAKLLGVTTWRVREIEKGVSNMPELRQSDLEKIAHALELDDDDIELLFELTGKTNENNTRTITPLLDYMSANKSIRKALKAGREAGLTNADWDRIADEIENGKISKTERDDFQ